MIALPFDSSKCNTIFYYNFSLSVENNRFNYSTPSWLLKTIDSDGDKL